jgi:DoxX-like family
VIPFGMTALTIVTTALAALLFWPRAWVKFTGEEHAMQTRDRLGVSPAAYRFIGVLEVAGVHIASLAVRGWPWSPGSAVFATTAGTWRAHRDSLRRCGG